MSSLLHFTITWIHMKSNFRMLIKSRKLQFGTSFAVSAEDTDTYIDDGTVGTVLFVLLILLTVLLILIIFTACYLYDFCNLFSRSKLLGGPTHSLNYKDYVLIESPKPRKVQSSRKHRKSKRPRVTGPSPLAYEEAKEARIEDEPDEPPDLPILRVTDTETDVKRRLRRPDSVAYLGLGKITFSLQYSDESQILTVYLICGKDICFRNGELATLPSVKLRIDDQISDEKESEPDESHNPEFDQEFMFRVPGDRLGGSALKLSIWDTDQALHKTLVGYIRVPLANFLESLLNPEGTGPISREITESSDTINADASLLEIKRTSCDQVRDEKESEPDESHNPEFDQAFMFRVPGYKLGGSALKLSIWDTDEALHKILVGYIRVPLANFLESLLNLEGTGPISREITESSDTEPPVQSNGQILFSLSYTPENDKLNVAILRCKNIETEDDETGLYVKVTMFVDGIELSSRTTPAVEKDSDPVFNEILTFENCTKNGEIDKDNLCLSVVIKAKCLEGDSRILGQVTVGQNDHTTPEGITHWRETMRSLKTAVAQWHRLTY